MEGDELRSSIKGQIEGLFTSPNFGANDESGRIVEERSWDSGTTLDHREATEFLLGFLRDKLGAMRLTGIKHRVVHGGLKYTGPVLLNSDVIDDLEELIPLLPLQQPYNVQPIRLRLERRPGLPQVACFDTQFHATHCSTKRERAPGRRTRRYYGRLSDCCLSCRPTRDGSPARRCMWMEA